MTDYFPRDGTQLCNEGSSVDLGVGSLSLKIGLTNCGDKNPIPNATTRTMGVIYDDGFIFGGPLSKGVEFEMEVFNWQGGATPILGDYNYGKFCSGLLTNCTGTLRKEWLELRPGAGGRQPPGSSFCSACWLLRASSAAAAAPRPRRLVRLRPFPTGAARCGRRSAARRSRWTGGSTATRCSGLEAAPAPRRRSSIWAGRAAPSSAATTCSRSRAPGRVTRRFSSSRNRG